MSYPVWPAGLVRFEREGWRAQPQDARRRRNTDAGPPGYARRFSSVARNVGLSLVVSRSELEDFWLFYDLDCARGASLFWMPDPTTHGWPLLGRDGVPMMAGDGNPLLLDRRWLCHFGDEVPGESVYHHSQFRVTFSIWVMP